MAQLGDAGSADGQDGHADDGDEQRHGQRCAALHPQEADLHALGVLQQEDNEDQEGQPGSADTEPGGVGAGAGRPLDWRGSLAGVPLRERNLLGQLRFQDESTLRRTDTSNCLPV